MDFLKSAVASAISKSSSLPYSFDGRVDIDQSIWTLHNSTKREDSSKCSLFSFDISANKSLLPLARNALRKLRTLRHPGIIKVIDTIETDTFIYIATERVIPLTWHVRRKSLTEETTKWGLFTVAKTLAFINGDATSVHGSIRASSVFTTESGEWKLGGFDILSSVKEDDGVIYTYGSLVPDFGRYAPPEIAKSGWEALKRNPLPAVDAYSFGILIYEVFNTTFTGTDQLTQARSIPPSMQQSYKRMISANPKVRISVAQFLEQGQRSGGFFETPLIHLIEGIENLGLKDEAERGEFLSQLDEVSDDFPEDFFKMKILPELLKSVEFGGGGPKVLNVIMKIAAKLSDDEYDSQITPVIVRLFQNPERALRVCLLDNLPLMIDHLSQKIVSNQIFPQVVTGFTDVAPVVREQTVKAVLTIVPKLTDRIINGELLRYLAKTANDEQPGIRTNTTICLGKIARNLSQSTRAKVLTAAFARALRDPFVHARNAALLALAATADLFGEEDCATKILPGICPSLIDKEKLVRDQANKALDIYMQRIRKYIQTLPDSMQPPTGTATSTAPRIGNAQSDSSSWAGWAISSFTNKLTSASGQMQTPVHDATTAAQTILRPNSVPPSSTPSSKASMVNTSTLSRGLPSQTSSLKPSARSNPFTASDTALNAKVASPTDIPNEDIDTDWGDAWGGNDTNITTHRADTVHNNTWDDENAWGDETQADDLDPFTSRPKKDNSAAVAATFDDKGEPDFAGWLEAQTQAKKKIVARPLPKELMAAKSARPKLGETSRSAGNTNTNVTGQKTVVPVKAAPKAEQKEEEDEGWGDAWE